MCVRMAMTLLSNLRFENFPLRDILRFPVVEVKKHEVGNGKPTERSHIPFHVNDENGRKDVRVCFKLMRDYLLRPAVCGVCSGLEE